MKLFAFPCPVPSPTSQMAREVSATTDLTVAAGGVYCEINSCSVAAQVFEAGYFSLPRCFHLLLLPLQVPLFVHSGPSFLCRLLLFIFFLLLLDFFFFQLTSSLVYLTLSILHRMQVCSACPSSLPDQSTVPSCHLNKGNPGHTDIACKSSCKCGYGKYSEQNKQQ